MRLRLHPGSTLVEAIAVMMLTSILTAVMAGILITQMRLARLATEEAASAEAVRTTAAILSAEVRRATFADVSAWSSDSLALRGFRGTAIPCGTSASGTFVRYTGDRMPDPTKDSVLVISQSGETGAVLRGWNLAGGNCVAHPGETVLDIRTSGPIPPRSALLIFESGSYHLSSGALRYRIGGGGRQPLTITVLRHPYSRFTGVTSRDVRFQVETSRIRSRHTLSFTPRGVHP